MRVSGTSRPNSVAGAIAAILRNEGQVEVQAIGANAVNQAVKAIAVARSYIEDDRLELSTVPSFVKLELQNEERTAVRFTVVSIPMASDGEYHPEAAEPPDPGASDDEEDDPFGGDGWDTREE